MSNSNRKSHLSEILIGAIVLVLVTCACGFHGPVLGTVTQDVTIDIPEDMFHDSSPHFMVNSHDFFDPLLDNVDTLELHDGFLRFIGTHTLADGSVVPASVDLYFSAQDGMLVARIIDLDIPGMDMDDPLVVEINQEMKIEFSNELIPSTSDVRFQEVEVTEEKLHMVVQVTIDF